MYTMYTDVHREGLIHLSAERVVGEVQVRQRRGQARRRRGSVLPGETLPEHQAYCRLDPYQRPGGHLPRRPDHGYCRR